MEKLRALIVDDEKAARDVLKNLLENFTDNVEVLECCENVPRAVLAIKALKPDVVFLDIEMPEFNGFELLQFFDHVNFHFVFVTAYNEYALRAFEVSAVDYILKPVQIEKLRNAVDKIRQLPRADEFNPEKVLTLRENLKGKQLERMALPMTDGLVFINLPDVVMIEADGSYTSVHLINGESHVVSRRIKFFEDFLESHPVFFRTHRSSIINLNYITRYNRNDGDVLLEGNHKCRISRERKQEFEDTFKNIKI
jgi:two-component system LytT family response regulator